ncbi:hypothetical protein P153DRAFT_311796 [Dothidotthia symphoricarpi CBS 119687]|uniref:LIM zinc-binding domain-containing protein n=1 Tax=Dothidotthia symphoricarpi CBS 119687 TaxID=1392245 RepID=A0A6A6ALT4_9PLEO|nr:uncharacterized protein P153DRAFT_311796 [Dothidotthia symphoricarpi CBS 119687]KAF2131431.1 hypothetical protein P153DRAFT_311796 [Dothidotthia symphoricarpi CBS 119687]
MSRPGEMEREGALSPGPAYYSPQQMKNYLQDLRTNRPARPTGSRPPPAHFNTWSSRTNVRLSVDSSVPLLQNPLKEATVDVDARPHTANAPKLHRRGMSTTNIDEIAAGRGRSLVQPPRSRDLSTSRERTPSGEGERRQTGKDEVSAVQIAIESLEIKAEEKLFESARDEAAQLVWKHQHPNAPEVSPHAPYAYPGLEKKKDGAPRSRSVEPKDQDQDQDLQRANSKLRKRHSMSSAASGSRSSSLQSNGGGDATGSDSSVPGIAGFSTAPTKGSFDSAVKVEKQSALAKAASDLPDLKNRRKSSGSRRKASGSLFQNPNDQIYEEPEEDLPPAPAPTPVIETPKPEKLPLGVRRNPFLRFQSIKGNPMTRSNTDPIVDMKKFDIFELHNNAPTRSHNAAYTLNPTVSKPDNDVKENEAEVKMKDGKEIRSDELRAATGFRLKDRSPKLPTPTAVSDAPGRPIVSFQKGWNEVELKEEISTLPEPTPRPVNRLTAGPRSLFKSATSPAVPTMNSLENSSSKVRAASPSPFSSGGFRPSSPAPPTRVNRTEVPVINIQEDAPIRPLSSAGWSRKVNTPPPAAPSVPTINVHQSPSTRSKPAPAPPIPTISVSETPSIAVSAPSRRGSSVKPPSTGFTQPIPTISVSETPAPNRNRHVKTPSITVTPDIPMISVNESPAPSRGSKVNAPSISVTPSVPSITVGGSSGPTRPRPLPDPKLYASKSFGPQVSTNTRQHWTPTTVRTGALCTQCSLPIAGRIVSAAGLRFHPECFACYQCGEKLECVAFYPEPDNKHFDRVARIRARQHGADLEFLPTHPTPQDMMRLEDEDGVDEAKRFFCHLDFHEMFSPRCKSCKTPIEGEVIVACGAEWHAGHFFCAQCGDPFDSSTPFVEKEGYAWCVGCHTNRYSTKCKGCRKPVTDTVVKALGAEWHIGCFCCVICSGPFDDGRYFLRGESQDPVCVKCEERRLKA